MRDFRHLIEEVTEIRAVLVPLGQDQVEQLLGYVQDYCVTRLPTVPAVILIIYKNLDVRVDEQRYKLGLPLALQVASDRGQEHFRFRWQRVVMCCNGGHARRRPAIR